MPNGSAPGHVTSPPLVTSAPPICSRAIRDWGSLAFLSFELSASLFDSHNQKHLQRLRFGGVFHLCTTSTFGEHHG